MSESTGLSDLRHLSWAEMRAFVEAEAPSVHVIDGKPRLSLKLPGRAEAMELRVPVGDEQLTLAPLAEIATRDEVVDGGRHICLRTTNPSLFPLFYEFALVVADAAQGGGVSAGKALGEAMVSWRRLLAGAAMLSTERQTGLFGELLVLEGLTHSLGPNALDSWTGPTKQAHDFRLENVELEVKTTRMERRVHTIHGVRQLEPSPRARLVLISVQLAPAGAGGESLAELIGRLRTAFEKHGRAEAFSAIVAQQCGILPQLEAYYRERLKLRTELGAVEVDDGFPRISASDVSEIKRPEMSRVSDVRFRLDIEDMVHLRGTAEFAALMPKGLTK